MAAILPATPYDTTDDRSEPGGRPPALRRHSAWPDIVFSVLAHAAAWLTLMLLAGAERGLPGALRLIPAELAGYLVTVLPLALFGAAVLAGYPGLQVPVTLAT